MITFLNNYFYLYNAEICPGMSNSSTASKTTEKLVLTSKLKNNESKIRPFRYSSMPAVFKRFGTLIQ